MDHHNVVIGNDEALIEELLKNMLSRHELQLMYEELSYNYNRMSGRKQMDMHRLLDKIILLKRTLKKIGR